MTHTDWIWILITISFSSSAGVYVAIRKIKQYTTSPVNTLHRRGDIELQEVIDPIQHSYVRDIDLSSLPQYPQAMLNNNHIWVNWDNPPRYSQLSNNLINSPLELELWDLIPWLIFLFIIINFIIIIFKYFNTNILTFLNKLKLFIDPLYILPILIPFSVFEIDFRDSFEWTLSSYKVKPKISYLKIQTLTEDIISLLNSLNFDEDYSMSLAFISSYKEWVDNRENITPLLVEDAIIINNESDPFLITHFIMKSLDEKGYFISNWLLKDSSINSMDPVILTVTAPIKVKI